MWRTFTVYSRWPVAPTVHLAPVRKRSSSWSHSTLFPNSVASSMRNWPLAFSPNTNPSTIAVIAQTALFAMPWFRFGVLRARIVARISRRALVSLSNDQRQFASNNKLVSSFYSFWQIADASHRMLAVQYLSSLCQPRGNSQSIDLPTVPFSYHQSCGTIGR